MSAGERELREEIRVTVLHETAHYFGFDEDELRGSAWGEGGAPQARRRLPTAYAWAVLTALRTTNAPAMPTSP